MGNPEDFQLGESLRASLTQHLKQNKEQWAKRLAERPVGDDATLFPFHEIDASMAQRENVTNHLVEVVSGLHLASSADETEDLALKLLRVIDVYNQEDLSDEQKEAIRVEIFTRDKNNPF